MELDGKVLAPRELAPGWQELRIDLFPESAGVERLSLRWSSSDERPNAIRAASRRESGLSTSTELPEAVTATPKKQERWG